MDRTKDDFVVCDVDPLQGLKRCISSGLGKVVILNATSGENNRIG